MYFGDHPPNQFITQKPYLPFPHDSPQRLSGLRFPGDQQGQRFGMSVIFTTQINLIIVGKSVSSTTEMNFIISQICHFCIFWIKHHALGLLVCISISRRSTIHAFYWW